MCLISIELENDYFQWDFEYEGNCIVLSEIRISFIKLNKILSFCKFDLQHWKTGVQIKLWIQEESSSQFYFQEETFI